MEPKETTNPVEEVLFTIKADRNEGVAYTLRPYFGLNGQDITFMEKTESGDVTDGVTNEAVLEMLIHRLGILDAKVPSGHTAQARNHLVVALDVLRRRTMDRTARGVEGTMNA